MKRSAFASLCGVSKQMISKHAGAGRIVEGEGGVDAEASLVLLEGHMDEAKRLRALEIVGGQGASAARAPQAPAQRSAKAEKEGVELSIKRLELGKMAGELVEVSAVEDAAAQAVAKLRERVSQGHRDTAAGICTQFGVAPDKAVALARYLAKEFEAVMGQFARDMQQLADQDASAASNPADIDPDLPLLAAGAH
ncbi:hypothetical protein [Brevundimonas sp.]|uniref:hypothetical protein n=1 Tax=Brevundimonas sp. TaxID=1871086 RepID=UPI002D2AE15D|nr:hypothetical protein [Brevundimonas sp.]HYD26982.1 hypothetical protein [Brevundimonas sp.]